MRHLKNSIYNNSIVFITVVETKNFSLAARKLMVSQPTVSRKIAGLEQELGVELIVRNTRNIEITSEGMDFYHAFTAQEQFISTVIDNFKSERRLRIFKIRIALPITIVGQIIGQKLMKYLQENPTISLEIIYQNREIDPVKDPYDLMVLRHIPTTKQFKVKHIYTYDHVKLYATPQYIQSYGKPQSPEELIPHLGISRVMDDFSISKEVIFTHKSGSITVLKNTTRLFTNSVLMDYFLVKSDHVIVGGCDTLYKEELAAGRIINILPDYELGPNLSFYLVYNNRQEKNQIVLDLINYIEQIFAKKQSLT